MRAALLLRCLLVAAAVGLSGCAAMAPGRLLAPGSDPLAAFPKEYRKKALSAEGSGDRVKALRHWRVVAAFLPGDREAGEKVALLSREIQLEADRHFREGRELLERGDTASARRELLAALRLDPRHARALQAVREQGGHDSVEHTVAAGETVESVAAGIMGDRAYGPLIARLNDLGSGPLSPGLVITVPASSKPLGPQATPEAIREYRRAAPSPAEPEGSGGTTGDRRPPLSLAIEARDGKRYREAVAAASRVPADGPDADKARVLINDSYYRWGDEHFREKRYRAALKAFRKADQDYKDVARRVIELEELLKEMAEEHYLKGVEHYVNQDLEKAIKEWEVALSFNPQHPKAAGDIEKAVALLDKLRSVK